MSKRAANCSKHRNGANTEVHETNKNRKKLQEKHVVITERSKNLQAQITNVTVKQHQASGGGRRTWKNS